MLRRTRGGLARPVRIPYCESLRFVAWAREAGRWTREHPRAVRELIATTATNTQAAFDQSDVDRRRTHDRTTGTTVIDSEASCPGCELGVEHEHR